MSVYLAQKSACLAQMSLTQMSAPALAQKSVGLNGFDQSRRKVDAQKNFGGPVRWCIKRTPTTTALVIGEINSGYFTNG